MKSGQKLCRYCKSELPQGAKVCPQCGRKQKKGIFKWLLIAFAVLIVIGIIAGNSGEDKSDKPTTAPESASAVPAAADTASESTVSEAEAEPASDSAPEAQEDALYHVGDTVTSGDLKIVYAASGVYTEENEFLQPKDGYQYIFLKFVFENTSKKSDNSVSSFEFDCFADGYAADAYYAENSLSATLSAGRATTGCIYFEVPKDAQTVEVEYTANMITGKKILFAFEGDMDSGYTYDGAQAAASETAYSVGDTAEDGSLKIHYLSCAEYTSDNMFVEPKEGYRYISCEFEFENTGSSDVMVSSFEFDCYADGSACDGCYIRDDDLSATLSSGRKVKGTVTFEVPRDAGIVELEYLSDYWTSERIVFSVSP